MTVRADGPRVGEAPPPATAGPLSSGRERLAAGLAAAPALGALVWAFARYGATQPWELYRVFLLLAAACLAACLGLGREAFGRLLTLPFFLAGVYLLARVAWHGSLAGRGYVLAAVGWTSLLLALWLGCRGRRSARAVLATLLLLGVAEAVYGGLQAAGVAANPGGLFESTGSATGSLVNPNHYAGLMNMMALLTLGWLYAREGVRRAASRPRSELWARRWLALLACSAPVLAVVLSRSRGGILALIATLSFCALLLAARRHRRRGPGAIVAAVGVLLVGGALAALSGQLGRQVELLLSAKARLEVYRDTLRLIADQPFTGIGAGMYEWRFRPFQTANLESHYYHAHNDYLETMVEWGVPLALVFWGFVGWRLYRACRIFLGSRDPWRRGLALGTAGAILALLLHGLIDFNLHIPGNLMVFAAVLGLAWSLDRHRPRGGERR